MDRATLVAPPVPAEHWEVSDMEDDSTELKPFSIYLMENPDMWYVGSAWNKTTPQDRYGRHYSGKGGARKLWEAIEAGAEFTQRILETGEAYDLLGAYTVEEAWIHKFLADDARECMNVNIYPTRRGGWAESPESIARRAEKAKGRPNPKNSERLKGKPNPAIAAAWADPEKSEIWRAAIVAGMAKMTEEARMQMRANQSESAKRDRAANPKPPKTHCLRGHEFTEENTYLNATTGARQCRECVRMRKQGLI